MATAGSVVVDLLLKTGSFTTDAARAEKSLQNLQKTASSAATGIGKAFAGIAAGVVAGLSIGSAVSSFVQGVNTAIDHADKLGDMSEKFGLSTEKLSAWGYAAKMSGTDLTTLTGTLPRFSKAVADAADSSSKAGRTFEALGIKIKDQAGHLRSVESLLPEVADRFKYLENSTTKTAVAMQLFGQSGTELIQFLSQGAGGLQEMEDRARALGIVIDSETAKAAGEFNDKLDDLREVTNGWFTQLASALLPTLDDLVGQMVDFVREGGNAKDIADGIAEAFRGIAATASAFGELEAVFDRIRGALAGIELQGNAAFQSLNPGNWNRTDLARLGDQYNRGTGMIEQGWKAGQTPATRTPAGPASVRMIDPSDGFAQYQQAKARESELQKRLDALFAGQGKRAGGSGRSAAGGKSEAERQAEALARAYESAGAALDRQIQLHGEAGEAAKLRYEIERGSLQGISEDKAAILLADAETLDILDDIVAMEQVWKQTSEEVTREAQRRQDAYDRVNQDILDQIELLGMTRDQQEAWNALAWAGVDATSEQGRALLGNIERMQQLRDATEDQIGFMDGLRDAGKGFFMDVTTGTKSFKDAALDAFDSLHQRILSMIAENLMDQLFGKQGDPGGGGWGNAIGSIFGSLFGGARAGGGDVASGRSYLVGEEGPEMFVPRTAGTIVPNEPAMAMAGGVGRGGPLVGAVNFNGYGRPDRRTAQQAAADVATVANRALARNGRGGR